MAKYSKKEANLLLLMKDGEGKSFKEIAKYLNRTEAGVAAKYRLLKEEQAIRFQPPKTETVSEVQESQTKVSPVEEEETVFVLKMEKIREALPKGAIVKFKTGNTWIELEV